MLSRISVLLFFLIKYSVFSSFNVPSKKKTRVKRHLQQWQGRFTTSRLDVLQKVRLILNRRTTSKEREIRPSLLRAGRGPGNFRHSTDHDENLEGLPWLLLLVHPAQQVVADDVDRAGLQAVFGLHHHVDAVRTQRWEPASEGLRARVNTIKKKQKKTLTVPIMTLLSIIQPKYCKGKKRNNWVLFKSTQLCDNTRREKKVHRSPNASDSSPTGFLFACQPGLHSPGWSCLCFC